MSRAISVAGWCAVLWLLATPGLLADDKPKPKPKEPPPAAAKQPPLRVGEAAIEKALTEPTQLEFVEAPLSDVIEFLKDHYRIEIQVDKKALDDASIGIDTPITINLRGVSFRSGLKLLLHPLNLTWTIQDEVLLITTPEQAETLMTTKVLDVSDLVVCRDKDDELWDDYETLIDQISGALMPTSWDQVGGAGSITGASLGTAKVLIVTQTRDVHEEIAALLAAIREIAKKNPDEEPPLRDRSLIRHKPNIGGLGAPADTSGLHEKIARLLADIRAIAKEFPEKEQPPTPEPSKKPDGTGGGKGMF
jgi:hypothetical protein